MRPIDAIERWRKVHGLTKIEMGLMIAASPSAYKHVLSGRNSLTAYQLSLAYKVGIAANLLLAPQIPEEELERLKARTAEVVNRKRKRAREYSGRSSN